jgi:hypothetical protein
MRYKRAKIDSLNLSSESVEDIYNDKKYHNIITAKSIGVFEPELWKKELGKPLTRNMVEAKILYTMTGLKIPLKRYAVSPKMQTIEFAGLHGYNDNDRSKWLMALLRDRWSQLQDTRIMRVDVAIDYKGNIPKRVIKKLLEKRSPFKWKNTIYYKTPKEKKTNPRMDIKIYDKAKKEKLDYQLKRLEFVFKSDYFKGLYLKDINRATIKMEKTIKLTTGLKVKITLF